MASGGISQDSIREKLHALVKALRALYHSTEELMVDRGNRTDVHLKVTQIETMFEEYSNVKRLYADTLNEQDAMKLETEYEKEVKGFQEMRLHIEDWLGNSEIVEKTVLIGSKPKKSYRSAQSTVTSFRTTSSTKRIRAIALRELAKLQITQVTEKLELESKQKIIEAKQLTKQHVWNLRYGKSQKLENLPQQIMWNRLKNKLLKMSLVRQLKSKAEVKL